MTATTTLKMAMRTTLTTSTTTIYIKSASFFNNKKGDEGDKIMSTRILTTNKLYIFFI